MIIPGWEIVQNFIRRQIGVRTDTASSTGSVHAKIKDIKDTVPDLTNTRMCIASATLRASADTERFRINNATYTKLKEMQANCTGVHRISFDGKYEATNIGAATIYKNGVAYSAETSLNSLTYVTYTQDLAFAKGDLIQLYVKANASASSAYVRNFRVYHDYSNSINVTVD